MTNYLDDSQTNLAVGTRRAIQILNEKNYGHSNPELEMDKNGNVKKVVVRVQNRPYFDCESYQTVELTEENVNTIVHGLETIKGVSHDVYWGNVGTDEMPKFINPMQIAKERFMFGMTAHEVDNMVTNAMVKGIKVVDMAVSLLSDQQELLDQDDTDHAREIANIVKYILKTHLD